MIRCPKCGEKSIRYSRKLFGEDSQVIVCTNCSAKLSMGNGLWDSLEGVWAFCTPLIFIGLEFHMHWALAIVATLIILSLGFALLLVLAPMKDVND